MRYLTKIRGKSSQIQIFCSRLSIVGQTPRLIHLSRLKTGAIPLSILFNLFFSFAAFACVFYIWHIRGIIKKRNILFQGATTTMGKVVTVTRKGNLSTPLIEYEYKGKTIQFTSVVSSTNMTEGQSIELQLAADGSARVAMPSSNFMVHVLSASMVVFFILGCLFVYDKFFSKFN